MDPVKLDNLNTTLALLSQSIFIGQHFIIYKIALFLEKPEEPGICMGLSRLGAYSIWLSLNKEADDNQPLTDLPWYLSAYKILRTWDGKKEFSESDSIKIKEFIRLLMRFQYPDRIKPGFSNYDWGNVFEGYKGCNLYKTSEIIATFEQQAFQAYMDEIIEENELIEIFIVNHMMSIIKVGNYYFFTCPNSRIGVVDSSSLLFSTVISEFYLFMSSRAKKSSGSIIKTIKEYGITLAIKAYSLEKRHAVLKEQQPNSLDPTSLLQRFHKHLPEELLDIVCPPLNLTAYHGNLACINYFLQQSNINVNQYYAGYTTLGTACLFDYEEIVLSLLNAGALVNQACDEDKYPLHISCLAGNLRIVKALMQHGANIHQKTGKGFTALHIACQQNNEALVVLLLESDIEIDPALKDNEQTPLWIACTRGNIGIVRLLLEAKANANILAYPELQVSPLWKACQKGYADIVKLLLAAGAEINQPLSDNTYPPIEIACEQNHLDVVIILLENSCHVPEGIENHHLILEAKKIIESRKFNNFSQTYDEFTFFVQPESIPSSTVSLEHISATKLI